MVKAVVAASGHSLFASLPCGNRKFTEPKPDGKIKLYLGRSILGRSILGRMESTKGIVCPFPCSQEGQRINV